MRVFLPITAQELQLSTPPQREYYAPKADATGAADQEIAEYEATMEACLASLELIRDRGDFTRRCVLAVDLPNQGPIQWSDVVAILIDDPHVSSLVNAACQAQTQDAADKAVAALYNHLPLWYDISERERLIYQVGADL
ncbi:DUF6912 family protein [Gleimia hominis]|uniref:DUF6912 family protein n=1 Tax=Gleimia hominis TaxID=595468 RepID=UPI000C80051D|nr:hypothetical protein [Gleimia hominis]WIK64782.1 hypothetical protein CJ187_001580 [Gleimia hominis]